MAIELVALKKRFGGLEVLRGIELTLASGRITAIVGPNAAGKTTLIKTILGLVRLGRLEGEVRIDGEPVNGSFRYRDRIGYMPQAARFPEQLTGREILGILQALRGHPADVDLALVEQLSLHRHLDKRVGQLSGGTRQKLNAVVALMFRPSTLILDEPTAGLDPRASAIFKDKVRRAVIGGATVVLTSHIVSELEDLAQDIVFLVEGRVEYHGSVADLVTMAGESKLERVLARMLEGRT
jgi:Cu-processing system ATP-binding protein